MTEGLRGTKSSAPRGAEASRRAARRWPRPPLRPRRSALPASRRFAPVEANGGNADGSAIREVYEPRNAKSRSKEPSKQDGAPGIALSRRLSESKSPQFKPVFAAGIGRSSGGAPRVASKSRNGKITGSCDRGELWSAAARCRFGRACSLARSGRAASCRPRKREQAPAVPIDTTLTYPWGASALK